MSPLSPMWVDSKELSRLTSISPRSLERLRSDGTIPFYKIRRRMVRYRVQEVMAALEKTKVSPRPYARMRKTLEKDWRGVRTVQNREQKMWSGSCAT